jgi:hypothetical protein
MKDEFGGTIVEDGIAQKDEFGGTILSDQSTPRLNETPAQAGQRVQQDMKTAVDENVSLKQAQQFSAIQWRKDNPKHWYDFLSRNADKFEKTEYGKTLSGGGVFSPEYIADSKIDPEYQKKVAFYHNAMLEDYKKPYKDRTITQEGFSLTGFTNPMNLTSWVSRTYGKGDISAWLDARESFVQSLPWTNSDKWKNLAVDFEKAIIELKGMPAKSAGGVFGLHSILQAPTATQSRQDWFDFLQSKGYEGTKSYAIGKLYDMLGGVENPYWRRSAGAAVGGATAAPSGDLGTILLGIGQGTVFTPYSGKGIATTPEKTPTSPVEAKTPETRTMGGEKSSYEYLMSKEEQEERIPETAKEPTLYEKSMEAEREKAKPKPTSPTSIKNVVVDKERAARGLQPMQPAISQKWGEAVNKAQEEIDFDPDYQKNLVNELAERPRAITDVEGAALDMHKVELYNERSKVDAAGIEAAESGNDAKANAMKIRSAAIEEQLATVDKASKYAGTETARGLAFRKTMMTEDYSVSAMESKKRAANGYKPLTPEQKAEIQKLHKQIEDLQAKLEGKPRGKETMATQHKLELAKQKFRQGLKKDQLSNRSWLMKIRDAFLAWRTAGILSGYTVLEKLSATALTTMVTTPTEEAVGSVLKTVAPKLMERAPSRGAGFHLNVEVKALSEAISKVGSDAADIMTKGETDFGLVYGDKEAIPPEAAKFFGHIHMALKTVPRRAEFTRRYAYRAEWYAKQGMDITEPANEMRIGMEALAEANGEIFLQDNFIVDAYKAGLKSLERPSKVTGKPKAAGIAVSTLIKTELPIVKIPTNLVGRIIEGATGLEVGGTKAVMAYIKGIENLPPEQANIIVRQIERGVVGTAMIATGMLLHKSLGGFYQQGEKRKKNEPAPHEIKIGDTTLPQAISHHPYIELMQVGATFMEVLDSRIKGKPVGWGIATVRTITGLLDALPFVRTSKDLESLRRDPEKFFRETAENILVPQLSQQIAKATDTDVQGKPVKRQSDTIGEQLESGVPVLRKDLRKEK